VSRDTDETEIRLATSAGGAARLWKSTALASVVVSAIRTQKLLSIYWDTPDYRLRDRGFALRSRCADGTGWVQTLKAPARRVDTRREYEAALPGMQPDLALARSVGWRDDAGLIAIQRELRPLFRTRVVRASRKIRFADGTLADLALDRGAIVIESMPHAPREAVLEIEIELTTGSACRIYELAYRLVAELSSTRLLFASKSERGYRLFTGAWEPARHAHPIDVSWKATALLVGSRAFTESLAHVQRNVERARAAEDREGVHQMRVGVRRLRVAAAVARKSGLPSVSDKLVGELRWLWTLLGQSRDLDVFEGETWSHVKQAAGDAAAPTASFDANLAKLRASAHRRLRRALDGRRFQRIMLSLAWIAALQDDAVTAATRTRRGRALATRMLARRAKRIVAVNIQRLPDRRRHRVRIDAKKLRYLAEFVAGLYPARGTRRYLRHLAAVQSSLGALNDLASMERTIEAASAPLTERERNTIVRMGSHYTALRRASLATELHVAWRKFAKTAPFWE